SSPPPPGPAFPGPAPSATLPTRRLGCRRDVGNGGRQGLRDRRLLGRRLAGLERGQELEHPRPALGCVVQAHVELGDPPEPDAPAQLVPDEGHRALERLQRLVTLLRLADDADPDARGRQVWRRLHVGDGHEADARVLDVAREDLADLLAQQLVDAVGSLGHRVWACPRWARGRCQATADRETVWVVKHSRTSPSTMSEVSARLMPHSKPVWTSRTSSLNRRRESIRSVAMTLPPRQMRMLPLRTIRPSVTYEPAMTLRPTLMILRTSARPSTTSTCSGSSMPD